MHLSEKIVLRFSLLSTEISMQHVENLIEQQHDEQLKVALNPSEIHFSDSHFTKMKVGITVQMFREAPAGIRHLVNKGALPPETEATSWFFELLTLIQVVHYDGLSSGGRLKHD